MTEVPSVPDPGPTPPWNVSVDPISGEAYRPLEVIIDVDHAARLREILPGELQVDAVSEIPFDVLAGLVEDLPPNPLVISFGGAPRSELEELHRALLAGEIADAEGVIVAEPNTVFMADAGHCIACPPHPAVTSAHGMHSNPVWANPVWANPVWANPVWANPVWANPVWANPVWANGRTTSSAQPANQGVPARPANAACGDGPAVPRVIILDTGLAALGGGAGNAPLLPQATVTSPDAADMPDLNADFALDPVAGHGTFIAGLVELACPGVRMVLPSVVEFRGDVAIGDVLTAAFVEIGKLVDQDAGASRERLRRAVLGMSFSGPMSRTDQAITRTGLSLLQQVGVVTVASAGNEGTCEKVYPAGFGDPTDASALSNVVSVGALGQCGPADFTNYGPWVRACAAGEQLTSSFFRYTELRGEFRAFAGWAQWSGSSFSVGVVIGALVREMRLTGSTASEAVARLVDAPGLPSIPNLGTVVT